MNFGVTVCEGVAAGTIVGARREVDDVSGGCTLGDHLYRDGVVVDAVRVFIDENERLGGIYDFRIVLVNPPVRRGQPATKVEDLTHGDTPNSGCPKPAGQFSGRGAVRGALVDIQSLTGETVEGAVGDDIDVGVAAIVEIADITLNPNRPAFGLGGPVIQGSHQAIPVIDGVKFPTEHDLLGIVHASDALSLGFGLAEGRKEHAGKDGDNSDDDEELDEREPRRP